MNIQVAYVDFVMNRQQRLAFAQTVVYVYDIFFLTSASLSTRLIAWLFPSPALKHDAVAAKLKHSTEEKLRK